MNLIETNDMKGAYIHFYEYSSIPSRNVALESKERAQKQNLFPVILFPSQPPFIQTLVILINCCIRILWSNLMSCHNDATMLIFFI